MNNAKRTKLSNAHFAASIIELGDRDEGRLIVTSLNAGEICLEFQRDKEGDTIQKLGFVLLSHEEAAGLAEGVRVHLVMGKK